jgi:hypothetical protein
VTITATDLLNLPTNGGDTMKIETACITAIAALGLLYTLAVMFATRDPDLAYQEHVRAVCEQDGGRPVDVLDRDGDVLVIRCDRGGVK